MATIFLLRHLKSQWNEENRFTGWVDTPLLKGQEEVAKILARKIFENRIDMIYSSCLFRNMDTVAKLFADSPKYPIFLHLDRGVMRRRGNFVDLSENDTPVFVTELLNERYYGKIQGMNKGEVIEKYGEEKVKLWRRSYNIRPPGGESLKDTFRRTIPFYKKYPENDLKKGRNVLIVASHNSLRSIAKYIEKISDKDIVNFEIPFSGLLKYSFDEKFTVSCESL